MSININESKTVTLSVVPPIPVKSTSDLYSEYKVIRRNGSVVGFEADKIAIAMSKAFIAVKGNQSGVSVRVRELVETLTTDVVTALMRSQPSGGTFHIEDIQD